MSLVKAKNISTASITTSKPKSLDNGAKLVYVNYKARPRSVILALAARLSDKQVSLSHTINFVLFKNSLRATSSALVCGTATLFDRYRELPPPHSCHPPVHNRTYSARPS